MEYSLCKMADFQNRLISRIFFFSSGFLHRTTLIFLQDGFSHVFGISNFSPKLCMLHGLQHLQDGRFSKLCHFWNIWCFFQRFFAQNNSSVLIELFFACACLAFLTFNPNSPFRKGYRLCKIFKIVSFLQYLVFFRAVFRTELL